MGESIGKRMRSARLEAGLTYQAASELAGVSISTISRSEAETTRPREATIRAVAGVYRKPVDWFYGEAVPEPEPINSSEAQAREIVATSRDEVLLLSTYRRLSPLLQRLILGAVLIGSEQPIGILDDLKISGNEGTGGLAAPQNL